MFMRGLKKGLRQERMVVTVERRVKRGAWSSWILAVRGFVGVACVASFVVLLLGGGVVQAAVPSSIGAQSQEEPSQTPSSTRPYYACPRSKLRPDEITCDGVIVPRAYRRAQRLRYASGIGGTQGGFQPDGGHGTSGTGFDPADLQRAYNLPSATAGSGQTVAVVIVGDNPDAESDLATYRATYGQSPCTTANGCFKKVNRLGEQRNYPPPAGSNWAVEGASDIEMVSAICPNCHIILVEAPGPEADSTLATAENTAAALGANEITNSWSHALKAEDLGYEGAFNHPGVMITVAGGDRGYTSQEWPAESPHVLAVGGTSLFEAPNARGFEEFAWSLGGSTCAQNEPKPSWQTDTGCAYRTTSDISAVADWKNSPVSIYDAYEGNAFGEIGWASWGGTSASSPIIAATYALTNAYTRSFGPQAIWQYAKEGGSLNDIISGKNSEGGCTVTYLCWAVPGFDGPTGWGTPWGAPVVKPPPTVATFAASEVGQRTAKLNGSVNPNGLDTHYYFEYGTTTSYGGVIPASPGMDLGAGVGSIPTWNNVSGLAPGVTYHFRVVASSSAGTVAGGDQVFTTLVEPNVFFADANHGNTMTDRWYSSTSGWLQTIFEGDEIGKGSSPGGVVIGGEANVFFGDATKGGTLTDRWGYNPTLGWSQTNFGGDEVAKGTSPTAVLVENNANVFFADASKGSTITDRWYNQTLGWSQTNFGGDTVAGGTSPSAVMVGNEANVFFVDASKGNTLTDRWYSPTLGWSQTNFGGDEVAKGTSPTAVLVENNINVFFVDASKGNTLTDRWYSPTLGWSQTNFGGDEVAKGTSPTAVLVENNANVFFADASKGSTITDRWYNQTLGWSQTNFGGDTVAGGTSPSAVMVGNEANVFFVDASKGNTLTDRWYSPTLGWSQTNFGGDTVAAGSSPDALGV